MKPKEKRLDLSGPPRGLGGRAARLPLKYQRLALAILQKLQHRYPGYELHPNPGKKRRSGIDVFFVVGTCGWTIDVALRSRANPADLVLVECKRWMKSKTSKLKQDALATFAWKCEAVRRAAPNRVVKGVYVVAKKPQEGFFRAAFDANIDVGHCAPNQVFKKGHEIDFYVIDPVTKKEQREINIGMLM